MPSRDLLVSIGYYEVITSDTKSGEILQEVKLNGTYVSIDCAPDDRTVACGGFLGQVCLVDGRDGRATQILREMSGLVKALCFSPDGSRLAAVSEEDGLVCFARKRQLWRVEWRFESIPCVSVAWSADGSRILIGDAEGIVHIVDLRRKELMTLHVKHRKTVFTVAWSHDDSHLATAGWDSELNIVATRNLSISSRLQGDWGEGFDYSGRPIAFSPDGQYIAWAVSAKLARVSSIDGEPAGELEVQSTILALAWSLDTHHLWVADSGDTSGLHPYCYFVEHCFPRYREGQ